MCAGALFMNSGLLIFLFLCMSQTGDAFGYQYETGIIFNGTDTACSRRPLSSFFLLRMEKICAPLTCKNYPIPPKNGSKQSLMVNVSCSNTSSSFPPPPPLLTGMAYIFYGFGCKNAKQRLIMEAHGGALGAGCVPVGWDFTSTKLWCNSTHANFCPCDRVSACESFPLGICDSSVAGERWVMCT